MRIQQQSKNHDERRPLVVLAGLPHPIAAAAANALKKALVPTTRVISHASGQDNRELYKPQTVESLLKAVSEYAVRQRRAHTPEFAPTQILLAYVPADDEERLLQDFDFFVFPVRLSRLAEYDDRGKQYRHDRIPTEAYLIGSIETALINFMVLKRRLSSPNFQEPLFLPPRNFKISKTESIANTFIAMRRSMIPWSAQLAGVQTAKVTHGDLKKHVPNGAHKYVLSDHRELLFPHDRSNHGPARMLSPESSNAERRQFMQSSFRFGVPLTDGYHHDVQHAGRDLGGEWFECCREGTLQLYCEYANVYPDDFVRPSKK